MSQKRKYPSLLCWVDLETTGLPEGNDFSGVEILEVGVIVTDFDLKPYFGYQGVVGINETIKAALVKNPDVVKMHLESGLLKDVKESVDSLQSIESEIIGMFKTKTSFDKGEFMIAGSGVAAYDFPLLKEKMPELASYFAYYSMDTGILRRSMRLLSGGKDLVPPTLASFKEGEKEHRALADVKAHLKEAFTFREFFQKAAESVD